MTDEQVLEIADKIQVLARSKPNDKHRLVTLLKSSGRVIAGTPRHRFFPFPSFSYILIYVLYSHW
jgi:hypothetical protein